MASKRRNMFYKNKKQETTEIACGRIPQRALLGVMCFLGLAISYTHRFCISLAITDMVVTPESDITEAEDNDSCPRNNATILANSARLGGEFDWDEATQGMILSGFFWGYGVTQLPAGIIAERIGGKLTLFAGLILSATCTLLTPTVAFNFGPIGLIALRVALGLSQGMIFPSINVLLAHWVPKAERGRFAANVLPGAHIGTVISMALGGVLIYYGGWTAVFYVFGILGIIWAALWILLCYDRPEDNPFISKTELDYLEEHFSDIKKKPNLAPIPWKCILTSIPFWSVIIVQFGHDWGLYTVVCDLPIYMDRVIHFTIAQNGVLSAAPYLMMCLFANICGWIVDWLIGPKEINLNIVRKIFGTIGAVGPAIGILAASYSGCNKVLVTSFFIIGMGLMGAYIPSVTIIPMDMSPNYTGVLIGFSGCISSISGIFVPYIIGLLTPNNALHEWRLVFWIAFGWLVITNIVYIIYGTAQLQPWNDPKVEGNKIDTNSSNGDEKSGGEVE